MDPRYRGFVSSQIPEATEANGMRIKVIAGAVDGVKGPVTDVSPPGVSRCHRARGRGLHPTHPARPHRAGLRDRSKAVFCQRSDPYSYDAEGGNYFDMERSPLLGTATWYYSTTATA